VRLGILYTQAGRVDDAIVQFDQALKVARDHQEALLYAGIAYMNKQEYDKALKYLDKEIKYYKNTSMAGANPSLEQAYYYGGVAYWKKKDYDKALDYLNRALIIKSARSDTYLVIGRIYLDKKSYDEAIGAFSKALQFDPSYADALYGSGVAYEAKGEKTKALDAYKAALKSQSDFKDAQQAVQRLEKELKKK
jgi:tetratricopeptide (TPR) repeat protein